MQSSFLLKPYFSPLGQLYSNQELCTLISGDINHDMVTNYLNENGTQSRYMDTEPLSIVDCAQDAVEGVLENNSVELSDIDGIIYASLFREDYEPATASKIAFQLGIPHAKTLDITVACSGMAHAVEVASGWLALNENLNNILLVSVELPFRHIDWTLNNEEDLALKGSGLTVGAAASALIISREQVSEGISIDRFIPYDDARLVEACSLPIDGKFSSNSKRLVRATYQSFIKTKKAIGDIEKNTWVLPHQPSSLSESVSHFLGLTQDRVISTHALYGNTVSSAWVSAYDFLIKNHYNEIGNNDPILIKTMAAGFSSLCILGHYYRN